MKNKSPLNQSQRDALWQCYSFLLRRRAARLAQQRLAKDATQSESSQTDLSVTGKSAEGGDTVDTTNNVVKGGMQ